MEEQDRTLVLVVDDDRVTRTIVGRWLEDAGYAVGLAADGERALALAKDNDPDLLLLDVTMPGLDGYEVCRAIQADSLRPPPVIFLTARGGTDARVAGLDAGAVDYMVKPFVHDELLARVRAALRTKAAQDGLAERATRDWLTGLLNRRELDERAEKAIELAVRHRRPLACLLIDVDRFKQINDAHGHAVGDEVLRETARRLAHSLRATDVIGRYGGEEFVGILPETNGHQGVAAADNLREAIAASPMRAGITAIDVRVSVGVAEWNDSMRTRADLYTAADRALYRAKGLGRDRTELESPRAVG